MASLLVLLQVLALVFATAFVPTQAQDAASSSADSSELDTSPESASSTIASSAAQGDTKVVQIFFIDERSYEGLAYTMLHQDSGSVLSADANKTTFIITSTRVDQRPNPTHSRTDNVTTDVPTLASSRQLGHATSTGEPSTITQGPATFEFTGTQYGPGHTLINRCSLNGTVYAVCNLTHVGSAWYTKNTAWNGTFSTYSYNWTTGDRFGFAPVTITAGAELLKDPNPTPSASPNGAARGTGSGVGTPISAGPAVAAFVVGAAVTLGMALML